MGREGTPFIGKNLMLAAGCGVTPIMSMTRWLLANRPETHVQVIFNVRTPRDVIFADEWRALSAHYSQLNLTLMAESDATEAFLSGRITREILEQLCPCLLYTSVSALKRKPLFSHPRVPIAERRRASILSHK